MIKNIFVSCFLAIAVFASAANFTAKLPPGTYKVWLLSGPDVGPIPSSAIETDKPTVALSGVGQSIVVYNEATGNLAILPAKPTTTVAPSDFNRVGELDIDIQQGTGPIGTASVTLKGKNDVSVLLDPSMNGVAKFYGVKIGLIHVQIQYNMDGKSKTTTQLLSAEAHHAQTVQTIQVAVPAGKSSVNSASTPGSSNGSAGKSTATNAKKPHHATVGEAFGILMQYFLGFAVVAALLYGGYWLIKKDPKAVSDRLRAIGAPIPADFDTQNGSNATNLAPVATPPPAPVVQSQILLPDATPDPIAPIGASVPPPTNLSPVSSPGVAMEFSDRPRLVRDNGEDWVIQEGSSVIGREAGLAISIIDESTISRKHGELLRTGNRITFQDLGSSNGSFLNGRRVESSTELSPGDSLQLGKVIFKLEA